MSVGRTATAYVLGAATTFGGSTIVSMGAGIIINSVLAISPTAMQVSLTVNSAAAVGPRTVTVTTGSQVLTLAGGVVVTPSLSVTQTSGVFAQGGSAVLQARLAPGKNFTPVVAGSTLAVGNATFGLPTGLTTIDNRWLGSDLAEVTVSLSPFASGNANLNVTFSDGQASEVATAFAPVGFTPVTPLTAGTPTFGALLAPRDVSLFSIAAVSGSRVRINLQPGPGTLLAPRLRGYVPGNDVPVVDLNASSILLPNATTTFTVSVVDANNGGAFSGYDFSINAAVLNTETEGNGTVATANPITLGAGVVGALSAADKDFFSFTVTSAGAYQFDTSLAGVPVDTRIYVCLAGAATCVYSTSDASASNSGQDEDSGPGLYSSLPINLVPGNYVVAVESVSAAATGDYLLTARAITPVVESEPNDSSATAQVFALGQTVSGTISALSDKDWYSVTVTTAGTYTLQTRPLINSAAPSADNLDTQIWICTAAAAPTCSYVTGRLTADDDSGQRTYSLANAVLVPGTYFIGVQPYSVFTGTLPGAYFLTVAPQ